MEEQAKSFLSKYTTTEKAAIDPIGEKDKIILSSDVFAIGEMLEQLKTMIWRAKWP